MTFRIGQKVICISLGDEADDEFLAAHPPRSDDWPILGRQYTVAAIYSCYRPETIELKEISSPGDEWWLPGFVSSHFAPLEETDISTFTKTLDGVNAKQKVPA